MAIDLESLKPILETLIEGREDGADVLDSVLALDIPSDGKDFTQADIDAAVSAKNAEWDARYRATFFNPPQEVPTSESASTTIDVFEPAEDADIDFETITFDDLTTTIFNG